MSLILLIPPPTDNGTNIFFEVLLTNLPKLFVPYSVATLSMYEISSAPLL